MKTLVISGSIRSRLAPCHFIFSSVHKSDDLSAYISAISLYQQRNVPISNSDILAGSALLAMRLHGAEIDYFPLVKLFPHRETKVDYAAGQSVDYFLSASDTLSISEVHLAEMIQRIEAADGVVLVSPTYFGDRSSVANKLLQISAIKNMLQDKVFGVCSVGAKRNGGQETTIIYSLLEALNQNALIVGNGPPTSQYGGTAVGGGKGTVVSDNWGLETAFGTGRRVAHVCEILQEAGNDRLSRPPRITILVTIDNADKMLDSFLRHYIDKSLKHLPHVDFRIENILDLSIYRCQGCDKCPNEDVLMPGGQVTKGCAIRDSEDSMDNIRSILLESDGIIIAGLNVKQHDQLFYRYQVLIERTRYIRRNNFELTDKLITAFCLNQVGARTNPFLSMKTVTSYIRHNAIMHKPIEVFLHEGKVIDSNYDDLFHFVQYAEKIALGRTRAQYLSTEYIANGIGGY
ncbi:flavodoxin family protein [candidate division CSSED10-310 bacterium]|uniref:Flavodoxin family protein n=1 Tax=candidate division CSSED10-310 bacterium TaxID=2855610 RepID=A0ABV6Z082_UNCC1